MNREKTLTTKKICMTGLFAAVAGVLMLVEIPLWFAPGFYKLDISEIPILILAFAYGPMAGAIGEAVKIVVKLALKGTGTAFVGELANFIIGCSFIIPAGLIYKIRKTKKRAILGCITGGLVMAVFGSLINAFYLIPVYAKMFGMPLEAIIEMATAINPGVTDIWTLVLMCVVPFNILKAVIDSLVTMLIYKRISRIIH